MKKIVHPPKSFLLAFLINAAVVATISSLTIAMRFAIDTLPVESQGHNSLFDKFFYELRMLPYDIATKFGLETKKHVIPNWLKLVYVFFISFIVALFVYYIFLITFGYKKLWKYFFGNF